MILHNRLHFHFLSSRGVTAGASVEGAVTTLDTAVTPRYDNNSNGVTSRDDRINSAGHSGRRSRRKQLGFTLIEVMVALFIVAIGLGAVVDSAGNTTLHAAHLKQTTIAGWVAQNQIAEHRAKRAWGTTGSRNGDVEMANANWRWRMTISKTDDPSLRRLDIEVFLDGEEGVKATATGFIAKL